MKTTLYITRHGETEWNIESRTQGWMDSPLTELGVTQAGWLRDRLKDIYFDAVYSSSSSRAYNTAEIIKGFRSISIIKDDDLREINMGQWEGKTDKEIREADKEELDNYYYAPTKYRGGTGEDFITAQRRLVRAIDKIAVKHQGNNVLIVTHGCSLKLIMTYFEQKPLERLWDPPYIYNTALCVIELENGHPNIILHGDVSHHKEID